MKKKSNVTVKDIAEKINISASTVSRALNNHPKISQNTKEKVWEAAKELGYLPNIPIYMQQPEKKIVLFLIDNLKQNDNEKFITSAQNILLQNGLQPIIRFIDSNLLKHDFLTSFNPKDVLGAISLLEKTSTTNKIYEYIAKENIPLITTHSTSSNVSQLNILPDLYNGAFIAANHLINQGAKNILLITSNKAISNYKSIEEGFKTAMKTSTSKFEILKCDLSRKKLNYKLELLFEEKKTIDAIISCNSLVTCKLYNFLNIKKIAIPSKIMIVSFGNEPYINYTIPSVSTVSFSSKNMGAKASKELLKLIKHNDISTKKLLVEPVKLIIKSSSMKV